MNDINKWRKYKFMRSSEPVRRHLPETRIMSESALWAMVAEYGDVIVKPSTGSRGKGVIRVKSLGDGQYEVHYESYRSVLQGKSRVYSYIIGKTGHRNYIVQRRIALAKLNGRPFDIRVIVQRKRINSDWKVTGDAAKVAGKGYIVTNIARSKGNVISAHRAIQQAAIHGESGRDFHLDVKKVALLTAKKLSRNYPKHRIFGLDMGLDSQGRTWIIEANLAPILSHFKKLKDQSMYRQILAYKKGSSERRVEGKDEKRPKKASWKKSPKKATWSLQLAEPPKTVEEAKPVQTYKPLKMFKPFKHKPLQIIGKPVQSNLPFIFPKPVQPAKLVQKVKPIHTISDISFWSTLKSVQVKKSVPLIYAPATPGK